MSIQEKFDFLIVGAGIVGLCMARALRELHSNASILILEKENQLGRHASGLNSGVVHRGLYYAKGSLKSQLCTKGAEALLSYCEEHNIRWRKLGKVVLPLSVSDNSKLDDVYSRAKANGARVEIIDQKQLTEIEPLAVSVSGRAIYSPETSVVDSLQVLETLKLDLESRKVKIRFNSEVVQVHTSENHLHTKNGEKIHFGHLVNTAGLHADKIANQCGISERYKLLPFKGIYWKVLPRQTLSIKGLIYPVPDLRVPFLGVHFTKDVNGNVFLGPTALPALGRENYYWLQDLHFRELSRYLLYQASMFFKNTQGFRTFAIQEIKHLWRSTIWNEARLMVPSLIRKDMGPIFKVGIRAQIYDAKEKQLVMDFLIETNQKSTHILNAVSPGFTSAFQFAKYVVDTFI